MPAPNAAPESSTLASDVPTSAPASNLGPYAGQTLSERYRLIRLLGRGGMGSVYLARHVVVGKPVAVKILDSSFVSEGQGFKRLFREAQAAASIGHPSIIDVQDVGLTPTGDPFLVMEYLEGEDLSSLMARHGPLSLAAACGVVEPLLSALNAAHAKGIVHRDLKPANIYLIGRDDAPPMVKLIDFGVSKFVGDSDHAKITLPGTVLGTPAYMSPEQARGSVDVDERADLYAIGVVLFQMLTGTLPFEGTNYNDLIFKIVYDEPKLLETSLGALPEEARSLIKRAIRKDPADRYQSASELQDGLRSLSAWADRADALAELAATIQVQVFGGGDLGQMTPRSRGTPIDVYALVGRDAAVAELADTRVSGTSQALASHRSNEAPRSEARLKAEAEAEPEGPRPPVREAEAKAEPKPKQVALPFVAVIGAVAVIALAAVWWNATSTPNVDAPASSFAAPPATPAPDRGVQITLLGVPSEATVFYDGAPVSMNPFRVRAGETIVPIRVEMPGHAPFLDTVVPSKDVTVQVTLVPEQHEDAAAPPAASSAAEGLDAPVPGGKGSKKDPGGLEKGGRDTFYTEKFE